MGSGYCNSCGNVVSAGGTASNDYSVDYCRRCIAENKPEIIRLTAELAEARAAILGLSAASG